MQNMTLELNRNENDERTKGDTKYGSIDKITCFLHYDYNSYLKKYKVGRIK